jgi:cytoskeleton protein RodZ
MTESELPAGQVELESPGRLLRELRESRSLSLADVAQRLKYATRQIEAIEADDFARLPDRAFVRGMVRSYGRFLGADEGRLLSALEKLQVSVPVTVSLPATAIPFPDGRKRATRMYGLLSVFAVFIAIAVAFDLLPLQFLDSLGGDEPVIAGGAKETVAIISPQQASSERVPEALSASQVPLRPEAPALQPAMPVSSGDAADQGRSVPGLTRKSIALRFEKDSWVEIRQGDGKMLLSQLNPAGTQQIVEGRPPFTLIVGNAPNVRVFYNEQPVDLKPHFKVDVARFTLE